MIHPNCDHSCTSDCRREGCNCPCGEFHDSATAEEIQESLADELRDTRIDIVKMITNKYTDFKPEYEFTSMSPYKLAGLIVDELFPEIDSVAINDLTEKN